MDHLGGPGSELPGEEISNFSANLAAAGWSTEWGRPPGLKDLGENESLTGEPGSTSGGLVIAAKTQVQKALQNDDWWELWSTGMWIEVAIPVLETGEMIYVAGVWGIPGARSHELQKRENERFLALVLNRAISLGNVPYYIIGAGGLRATGGRCGLGGFGV